MDEIIESNKNSNKSTTTLIIPHKKDEPLETAEVKKIEEVAYCNGCKFLELHYLHENTVGNAWCQANIIRDNTNQKDKFKGITYNNRLTDNIKRPYWCPNKDGGSTTIISNLSYMDRKEPFNSVPTQHETFESVKVGECYRIPKIMDTYGKTIKIVGKTEYAIRFKEIKDDGTESAWETSIFKSDVELKFLVRLNEF